MTDAVRAHHRAIAIAFEHLLNGEQIQGVLNQIPERYATKVAALRSSLEIRSHLAGVHAEDVAELNRLLSPLREALELKRELLTMELTTALEAKLCALSASITSRIAQNSPPTPSCSVATPNKPAHTDELSEAIVDLRYALDELRELPTVVELAAKVEETLRAEIARVRSSVENSLPSETFDSKDLTAEIVFASWATLNAQLALIWHGLPPKIKTDLHNFGVQVKLIRSPLLERAPYEAPIIADPETMDDIFFALTSSGYLSPTEQFLGSNLHRSSVSPRTEFKSRPGDNTEYYLLDSFPLEIGRASIIVYWNRESGAYQVALEFENC